MTITDLKTYANRINAEMKPTDKMSVTLSRGALAYILAYLKDREKSLMQSMTDSKISDKKREKRQYEHYMVKEALNAIAKARQL